MLLFYWGISDDYLFVMKYNNLDVVEMRGIVNMVNSLLTEALDEVKKLKNGEIFLVKDLFKGYLWSRNNINERSLLGAMFLNEMKKKKGYVEILDKTMSGQQRYMKL